MQLSEQEKPFYPFFAALLKNIWNSQHVQKKDGPYTFYITEIRDC